MKHLIAKVNDEMMALRKIAKSKDIDRILHLYQVRQELRLIETLTDKERVRRLEIAKSLGNLDEMEQQIQKSIITAHKMVDKYRKENQSNSITEGETHE